MTIWLPALRGRHGPAYRALADAIGDAVTEGQLAVGDRLPPQRDLAYRLSLSLSTVTRAYAEATRRGLVEGTVGRGTYVRRPGAQPSPAWHPTLARPVEGPIDFASNLPFIGGAAAALARTLAALSVEGDLASCLDHAPEAAMRRHAEAGARWIGEQLGLGADGRSVCLVNGAQQGLFVSMLALTRPGDAILVEELTYPPVLAIARHLGLSPIPVAMDHEGLCAEALDALSASTGARLLYTMPTLHTPTAATMTEARRRAVAAIVIRRALTVIEDDVFGFLPRLRPPPLAAFAPDNTLFVTSTSKSLAPGLRVGYVHAPARLEGTLLSAIALSSWMPPPLMAEIATRWIEDGTAHRLNEEKRVEAEFRQALAGRTFDGLAMRSDPCGSHIWLALPRALHAEAFETAARDEGVLVRRAVTFAVDPKTAPAAIRICLSHEPSRDRAMLGLARIAALLEDRSDASAFVV